MTPPARSMVASGRPALAGIIDATTVACLLFGETVWGLWGAERWTLASLSPLFLVGCALFLVRIRQWRDHARRLWTIPRREREVVLVAFATRVLVLACGVAAVTAVGYQLKPGQFRVSHNEVFNLPARSDAGWYLGIARHGYRWSPELHGHRHSLAFFPAYPVLMHVAGDIVTIPAKVLRAPALLGGGDARVLWGGVFLSIVCFATALRNVYQVATIDQSPQVALRAVVLLACYPFALFFGAAYSESLFLLAASGAVLGWMRADLRRAAAWGVLAGLTRSNGWTLTAALFASLVFSRPPLQDRRRRWLVACAPLLGACVFSAYAWWISGSPLEWATAQAGWGRAVSPVQFFTRRIDALGSEGVLAYLGHDPVDAATAAAAMMCLGTAAWQLRRGRMLFATLIGAYLIPALMIDLPATGRMTSVLFPAFLCLAEILSGWRFTLVVVAFAAGQLFFTARYFLWQTPY